MTIEGLTEIYEEKIAPYDSPGKISCIPHEAMVLLLALSHKRYKKSREQWAEETKIDLQATETNAEFLSALDRAFCRKPSSPLTAYEMLQVVKEDLLELA